MLRVLRWSSASGRSRALGGQFLWKKYKWMDYTQLQGRSTAGVAEAMVGAARRAAVTGTHVTADSTTARQQSVPTGRRTPQVVRCWLTPTSGGIEEDGTRRGGRGLARPNRGADSAGRADKQQWHFACDLKMKAN